MKKTYYRKTAILLVATVIVSACLLIFTACDGSKVTNRDDYVTVLTFRKGFFYLHIDSGYPKKGGPLGDTKHAAYFKTDKATADSVKAMLDEVADDGVEYVVHGENIWGKVLSDRYGRSVAIRYGGKNDDGTSLYTVYSCAVWLGESNAYIMVPWHLTDPNAECVTINSDASCTIENNADLRFTDNPVDELVEFYEFNGYSVSVNGNTLEVKDNYPDAIRENDFLNRELDVPEAISFTVTVGEGTIRFSSAVND